MRTWKTTNLSLVLLARCSLSKGSSTCILQLHIMRIDALKKGDTKCMIVAEIVWNLYNLAASAWLCALWTFIPKWNIIVVNRSIPSMILVFKQQRPISLSLKMKILNIGYLHILTIFPPEEFVEKQLNRTTLYIVFRFPKSIRRYWTTKCNTQSGTAFHFVVAQPRPTSQLKLVFQLAPGCIARFAILQLITICTCTTIHEKLTKIIKFY